MIRSQIFAMHAQLMERANGAFAVPSGPRSRLRYFCDRAILAAIGVGSITLWLYMRQWQILADHAAAFAFVLTALLILYGLAVAWVVSRQIRGRSALIVIFFIAVVARLVLIQQIPTASDDIYRYVWDGRVQAAGINAYRYPPQDIALITYRDPQIYPNINRKNVRTIYPPVAEAVFRVIYTIYPNSVTWTKYAISTVDLAIGVVLVIILRRMRWNPALVLLYLWHPLLVLEVAHSGHIDIVAVLFLLLAVESRRNGRQTLAGVWCAAAVLVKFYVLAALPALMSGMLRRRDFRLPLAFVMGVVLPYLPFLSVGTHVFGFLGGYAEEEGFASGQRYFLLQEALRHLEPFDRGFAAWYAQTPLHVITISAAYTGVMLLVLAAASLWCLLRPVMGIRSVANRVAVMLLLLFTLTTSSQPWYLLVLLVCVPLVEAPLAVACLLAITCAPYGYLHWWIDTRPILPWWIEYNGRALALMIVLGWASAETWRRVQFINRWRSVRVFGSMMAYRHLLQAAKGCSGDPRCRTRGDAVSLRSFDMPEKPVGRACAEPSTWGENDAPVRAAIWDKRRNRNALPRISDSNE